jgi:drug/metabolite transporter (DMT)-like permease
MSASPRGGRALVVVALAALYVIWGSTYFAIRIALDGIPPLLMAGSRFLVAGVALLALGRAAGERPPSAAEWRAGAVVGVLLCTANALVTLAEEHVSSNVAAVVVSSVPLWSVIAARLGGDRPRRSELVGLGIGLAGVVLLQSGGELRARPIGAVLLVVSTWCWAAGSMWSRKLPMPRGLFAPGTEMLVGGALVLATAFARGERMAALPDARPAWAWLYLMLFGSLTGYAAYNFLLRRVRPALATSYAYVNPAVAVALGASAGEPVGARTLGALALILGGVAVMSARAMARRA